VKIQFNVTLSVKEGIFNKGIILDSKESPIPASILYELEKKPQHFSIIEKDEEQVIIPPKPSAKVSVVSVESNPFSEEEINDLFFLQVEGSVDESVSSITTVSEDADAQYISIDEAKEEAKEETPAPIKSSASKKGGRPKSAVKNTTKTNKKK